MNMIEQMQELHRRVQEIEERGAKRLAAIEARLPKPIPVVEPLSQQHAPSHDYRISDRIAEYHDMPDPCSCCSVVSELQRKLDAAEERAEDAEAELTKWKEEWRDTEESRASFEDALNRIG